MVFAKSIEARCSVENEDVVGAAPTGDAPTTSELSTILLPNKVRLILEVISHLPDWLNFTYGWGTIDGKSALVYVLMQTSHYLDQWCIHLLTHARIRHHASMNSRAISTHWQTVESWVPSQYKDRIFRYCDSHVKDKTVVSPSYL